MSKLIVDTNVRCHLEDEDDVGFLWELDKELSFDVQGAEHTRAFKRGWMDPFEGKFVRWDGTEKLLESDNLSFPIGLRHRVEELYKRDNRELEIVDNRSKKSIREWHAYSDVLERLQSIHKVPYPHQIQALNATKQHDRGIIRVATGGGKTLIAALIVSNIGKKAIVYVIGKDLLYQIHKFFECLFPSVKVGIIGDGKCEIGDINIASVWTVGCALGIQKGHVLYESDNDEAKMEPAKYGKIRQMMQEAKVNILDECHVAACQTIQEIAKHISPEHFYGMSASPWRDDGADLLIESVLGQNIVDISASKLIREGLLVKPVIKFERVPKMPGLKKNFQTIYKNYVVENNVRNQMVTDATDSLVSKGYKTLVLYNSVRHGKILYDQISKRVPCVLLSGKDSQKVRLQAREDLNEKKIGCIIASRIFDIGVDMPSLSGLVIAGCGKSSVRALQRIGRVIRRHSFYNSRIKNMDKKKLAAVVDFVDDAAYLKYHAQERKKIYSTEEEFDIKWPTKQTI